VPIFLSPTLAALGVLAALVSVFSACAARVGEGYNSPPAPEPAVETARAAEPKPSPTPEFPDLQKELLDDRYKTTDSPIGKFDFKNYGYPLPRGWQDKDGDEAQLENGARRMTEEKIGLSYVTTKFLDATGDGQDEAIVILKIVTAGSAIPQIVYIFEWKDGKPELIWFFRTGDRADGGLKDLRPDDGTLAVEIYGQDRFILGAVETSKITGDEEQLCCPTYFARTHYKWNGKNFLMDKKRLTFSVEDPNAEPEENLGDKVNNPNYNKAGAKK
jgi:hypothetical protein